MAGFSKKYRKSLRKFFIFLGVAAISLVFQACYGMPPDGWDYDNSTFDTEGEYTDNPETSEKNE